MKKFVEMMSLRDELTTTLQRANDSSESDNNSQYDPVTSPHIILDDLVNHTHKEKNTKNYKRQRVSWTSL